MRTQARLKLGYYPLPESEAQRMRRFVRFPAEQCQTLDARSGTGAALKALSVGASARTHGIKLDAYRAAEARGVLDEVIQGSTFDTHAPVESFLLLYLNPPYDFGISGDFGDIHDRYLSRGDRDPPSPAGGGTCEFEATLSSPLGWDPWSRLVVPGLCIAVPRLHAPSADSSGNHTFLCGLALGRESPGQSQSNPRRWRPKIELGCKPPAS